LVRSPWPGRWTATSSNDFRSVDSTLTSSPIRGLRTDPLALAGAVPRRALTI
jgi:hypothetical protein